MIQSRTTTDLDPWQMMVPWILTRARCAPAGGALVHCHLSSLQRSSFQSILFQQKVKYLKHSPNHLMGNSKYRLIQWNCRGIKPRYEELLLLLTLLRPSVFFLQETYLKPEDNFTFKKFKTYNHIHSECLRASGGSSILVNSSLPQHEIKLKTDLQAVAVSGTLEKEITLCSVYIPPSFSLRSEHLNSYLQQLPSPYMLLGNFNGHNVLWGSNDNDHRGELIEDFITKKTTSV